MTDEIKKFKGIFEGLESAYGQTVKTDQFDDRGKHKTKSFTVSKPPIDSLWKDHLKGKDPALGIVPINKENKCKWGCIDVDEYPLDHIKIIKKLKQKGVDSTIVFRSKSGGAHIFLFTKNFIPAITMREKLKTIAAALGYSKSEIFPKQDYIRVDRGDTGSFLNLPYHGNGSTVRYAFDDEGKSLTLEEFYNFYNKKVLTEEKFSEIKVKNAEDKNDDFKGMPPCLVTLLTEGVGKGSRNDCMYNVGVYLKKRYTENDEWKKHMHLYNEKYMSPSLESHEMDRSIESVGKKDYQYKCNQAPIEAHCDAKLCVKREFGVGDNVPAPEIKDLKRYMSDPPVYFVNIDGKTVEVDSATLHDPEKFSIACMDQIGMPMMPISKSIWRRLLIKLFSGLEEVAAPESTKLVTQLKDLVTDFISKVPGKEMKDIKRGISYTDENNTTYFKLTSFWNYLIKSRSWQEKTYPKNKTVRLLQQIFRAEEGFPKVDGKTIRCIIIKKVDLESITPTQHEVKKEPWQR